jgi:Fe-Mn family superoxide dismutase
MATRRGFLHNTAAVGAGIMLAQAQTVYAAENPGYRDKLTDADGKYAAGPLPFAYDALEPVIDARTVELHYNCHHKPAVVAARDHHAAGRYRRDRDFDNDHKQLRYGMVVYDYDARYAWCQGDAHN